MINCTNFYSNWFRYDTLSHTD